ncbi:molybdate ABC transporter substrate-binding protein [Algirhabdus cladophorae]|uniref:molybdate ABC transporter substrate-binding protein n=1 Tax=Algirhabdus cladophorae TaxID=3377108 RepID=UPI003B848AC0
MTLALRLLLAFTLGVWAASAQAQSLSVWAASSLKTVLEEAAEEWDQPVSFVFAGTPALARQIKNGAPADVFIAAHPDWTMHLIDSGVVPAKDVKPVFSNRLVIIASDAKMKAATPAQLETPLQDRRFAIPITRSVPAGVYGKQALEGLGLWDSVKDKLVETQNVRQALALVARGETPLGLVYRSDALADPSVYTILDIPAVSHDPILYSAAQLGPKGAAFLAYLSSEKFQNLLIKHGFEVLN